MVLVLAMMLTVQFTAAAQYLIRLGKAAQNMAEHWRDQRCAGRGHSRLFLIRYRLRIEAPLGKLACACKFVVGRDLFGATLLDQGADLVVLTGSISAPSLILICATWAGTLVAMLI